MRIVIGFCFLVVGFALIFYPQIEKLGYDSEQQQLVDSFEELGQEVFTEPVLSDSEENIAIVPTDFGGNKTENDEKNDMLRDARAVIRISSIDLEMVVFNGASTENLEKGIGMIEPQKEIGVNNIGLAGHRAIAKGKQFNRLGEMKEGDAINIQTKDGEYEFIVTRSFVVNKSDVSVLEEQEEPLVTLVTCTPIGRRNPPDRLIVQAELNHQ